MKKFIVFLLAFVTICLTSHNGQAQIILGPKVGINLGSPIPMPLSGIPDGASGSNLFCPNLGVFSMLELNKNWSFRAEIIYTRKAARFFTPVEDQYYAGEETFYRKDGTEYVVNNPSGTYFTGDTEGTFDLRYLEFPLMASYHTGERFSLLGGVYVAVLLKGDFHGNAVGNVGARPELKSPEVITKNFDYGDDLNSVDYGINVGAQYMMSKRMIIDARFSSGLNSLFKKDFTVFDYKLYHVFMQFGLAYQMGKGAGTI